MIIIAQSKFAHDGKKYLTDIYMQLGDRDGDRKIIIIFYDDSMPEMNTVPYLRVASVYLEQIYPKEPVSTIRRTNNSVSRLMLIVDR